MGIVSKRKWKTSNKGTSKTLWMWLVNVGSIPAEAHHFNQAIEIATWQRIKQYDNSVAGAPIK